MQYFNTILEALDYIATSTPYTQLCRARTGEVLTSNIAEYRALRASVGGLTPCAIDGDQVYLTVGIRKARPLSKPTYTLM